MLFSSSTNSNGGADASAVPCQEDRDCHILQGPESICEFVASNNSSGNTNSSGICTNPFASGCLHTRMPELILAKRVCNSDDSVEEVQDGMVCTRPEFDYMEVRLTAGNWESILFNAWVMQILLSELLGVPTTLEPGLPDTHLNFYDAQGRVEYGEIQNSKGFENAHKYQDCRLADRGLDDPDQYEPCVHLVPEFWSATGPWAVDSVNKGSMEPPQTLGVLAQETLYVILLVLLFCLSRRG